MDEKEGFFLVTLFLFLIIKPNTNMEDNKVYIKAHFLTQAIVFLFYLFLCLFFLKKWKSLSSKNQNKIIYYSILVYIISAIIGLIFLVISWLE